MLIYISLIICFLLFKRLRLTLILAIAKEITDDEYILHAYNMIFLTKSLLVLEKDKKSESENKTHLAKAPVKTHKDCRI